MVENLRSDPYKLGQEADVLPPRVLPHLPSLSSGLCKPSPSRVCKHCVDLSVWTKNVVGSHLCYYPKA